MLLGFFLLCGAALAQGASACPSSELCQPTRVDPAAGELGSLSGLRARLVLLNEVNSRLPSGTGFIADVAEPVVEDGKIRLPKGTRLEGHTEARRARIPFRSGSLRLIFDRIRLPEGAVPVSAALTDGPHKSERLDREGLVHPGLSKKHLILQLGGSLLLAKLADDLTDTAIGPGKARYVGLGAGALFLVLQRGRDVKIQAGQQLEVEFGRSGSRLPLEEGPHAHSPDDENLPTPKR